MTDPRPTKWAIVQHWDNAPDDGGRSIFAPHFSIEDPCCFTCGWFSERWKDGRVEQSEPGPDSSRCVLCTHPKGDHDGHAEHRAKYSPLVAGDPYCHACNGECDFAGRHEFTGIKRGCFYGDRAAHMVRRVGIQNRQTACGRWVWDKASKWLPRGTKITCPDCTTAVKETEVQDG